jgi:hypothetical protein
VEEQLKKLLLVAAIAFGLCVSATAQRGSLKVVFQSQAIERLIERHIEYNNTHRIDGFRVRIFRDNGANSRQRSQEERERFQQLCPEISTYLTYDNPYFKVAVGDFRTKDEALALLFKIKPSFPKAFIIAESIHLPPLQRKGTRQDDGDKETKQKTNDEDNE